MAFTSTSRDIRLEGAYLKAQCSDDADQWHEASLNLNSCMGNNNGAFDLLGYNFANSASNIRLEGSVLHADLITWASTWEPASLDLNMCVANVGGDLKYTKLTERITSSCSALSLQGTVLKGLCLAPDGQLQASSIDLNYCYSNSHGEFDSSGKGFVVTAKRMSFASSDGQALLRAELAKPGYIWQKAEVDVADCILNKGGQFIFEKHTGRLDHGETNTMFLERKPAVEHCVSGIRAKAGDDECALPALSLCANSPIVLAGIVAGSALGGPAGRAISAGLASPVCAVANTFKAGFDEDADLRSQYAEATIGSWLYDTLRNLLAPGSEGYFAEFVDGLAGAKFYDAAHEVSKTLEEAAKTTVTGAVHADSYFILKKIADALVADQMPSEWGEAEHKAEKAKRRTALLSCQTAVSQPVSPVKFSPALAWGT